MTSRALVSIFTVAVAIGPSAATQTQQEGTSWLDQPKPASWNKAGSTIPSAPKVEGAIDARCRESARPPQLPEDKRVREQGWTLVGAYQGGWDVILIRGTAGYDGMCRPRQFQDFVFVRGAFAGTLSPQPMDSRTDGALQQVSLLSSSKLTAEYARYAPGDALCCPSKTTTVVFDITADGELQPANTITSTPSSGLAGTSWQLVKFEGSDEKTLMPDERSKYTIEFSTDGQVSARIDCNRGRGTWKSSGPSQIEFGPMALTRAQCAPGSMHDQIVNQWENIRSYVLSDGHLFLSLKADGGIYEFEPIAKRN